MRSCLKIKFGQGPINETASTDFNLFERNCPRAAGAVVPFTVMEENLYNVPDVGSPAVGNGVFGFCQAFDVSINDTNKIYHNVNWRMSFTAVANGDILAVFSAPLGLPFVIGTNGGTVFEGTGYNATSGDAKCADLTMTSAGDALTQAFNVAVHNCVAGETYSVNFQMAFLN